MLTLFDPKNKPHVVATYSPNQKRLSGAEGAASSAPKDQYHDYIIDLAKHLGVSFDYDKASSKLLKLKGALQDQVKEIKQVIKNGYVEIFKVTMNDASVYYTDSYDFISATEIMQIAEKEFKGNTLQTVEQAFDRYSGINTNKTNLYRFIEGER